MVLLVKANDVPKAKVGPVQMKEPLEANFSVGWGSACESVWLQFEGVNSFDKMQFLNQCLVGQWGDFSYEALLIPTLKEWARLCWRLKGKLLLCLLGGSLILFEFELAREVERVLQEVVHVFKQKTGAGKMGPDSWLFQRRDSS